MIKIRYTKATRMLALLLAFLMTVSLLPVNLMQVQALNITSITVTLSQKIEGATVVLTNTTDDTDTMEVKTDQNGVATFKDYADTDTEYSVNVTAVGYETYTSSVPVKFGIQNNVNITLTQLEKITIYGSVLNPDGSDYENSATVSYSATQFSEGDITGSVTTSANGYFSIKAYKGLPYQITVTASEGYQTISQSITTSEDYDLGDLTLAWKTFSITAGPVTNGVINGTGTATYGSDNNIVVTADEGYRIETLTINGEEVDEASDKQSYTSSLNNIASDYLINATFYRMTYDIAFSYDQNGQVIDDVNNTIDSNGGTITVNEGDDAGFRAVANPNYHVSKVVIDNAEVFSSELNGDTEYDYTFTDVQSVHSVFITFKINTYTVSLTNGENGSSSIGAATPVITQKVFEYDGSGTIYITPDTGYNIDQILVNNVETDYSVIDNNGVTEFVLTLNNITEDKAVSITYIAIGNDLPFNDENITFNISSKTVESTDKISYYYNHTDSITFTTNYKAVRLNGEDGANWINQNSITISDTTLIHKIEVFTGCGRGKGWHEIQLSKDIEIVVDKTKPIIATLINTGSSGWLQESAVISGTVTDAAPTYGITKVVWNIGKISDNEVLSSTNFTTVTNGEYSFSISGEQNNTYYLYVVDEAGNVSEPSEFKVQIDTTAPVISAIEFSKKAGSTVEEAINFLSFGIFFKEDINVTVTAYDTNVSSGLNEIALYSDGVEIERQTVSGSTATFTVGADDFSENSKALTAEVWDNSDRSSGSVSPVDLNPDTVKSDKVMIDKARPEVSFEVPDEDYKATDGSVWYKDDTTIAVSISDVDSGIRSVEIKVNGEKVTADANGTAIKEDYSTGDSAVKELQFNIDTAQNSVDGKNVIEVAVVDNAWNENEDTSGVCTVYVDKTAPVIKEFEITHENDDAFSKAVNFLSFGIFCNEKVKVTITATDDNASSKLSEITLYLGDDVYEVSDADQTERDEITKVFYLPAKDILDGEEQLYLDKVIAAMVTDNVGNSSGQDAEHPDGNKTLISEVNSNIKDSELMIETVKPVIDVAPDSSTIYTDSNNNLWYDEDVDFTIVATDTDSGIRSIEVMINGQSITSDINGKPIDEAFYERDEKTNEESFVVSTKQGTRAEDGSYLIRVTVTDNAGNVYTSDQTKIYKDIAKPYITQFEFATVGAIESEGTNTSVLETDYGYYFLKDTLVKITAADDSPSSGVKAITYYTVDMNNGKSSEITIPVTSDQIQVTIPADFKGQIYAKAIDNVENITESYVNPNSVIVESQQKHSEENHITFAKQQAMYKDSSNLDLYSDNVAVTLTVNDSFSGIRKVEWSVEAPNDTTKDQSGVVSINNDKSYTEGSDTGWTQTKTEKNLVTEMQKTVTVSNNSNNIVVKVRMTDRAGNYIVSGKTDAEGWQSISFSIDKDKPVVSVSYDKTETADDSSFTGMFQSDRVLTVKVKERNFAQTDTQFAVQKDGNTYLLTPDFNFEHAERVVENDVEYYIYTMNYTFHEDGDYSFALKQTDMAGNVIEDSGIDYGSAATKEVAKTFTIDQTDPIIEVSYASGASVANGIYYSKARTATIKITEHNFDKDRISVSGIATDNGNATTFPANSSWTTNGDVHTATIVYDKDAKYSFDIDSMDQAGNKAADYRADEFYVDTTAPTLTITGVANASANKGDVIPVISYSDTNFNTKDVSLTLSGANRGNINPEGNYTDITNGQTFTFTNFSDNTNQNIDDIYSLSATLVDYAGNKTTNTITFSVNRFGSVYVFGNDLNDIEGKYITNERDIVITETNVDNLVDDSIKIKMTKNNIETKDLVKGTDYSIVKSGGNGSWSQYVYTIYKSLFTGDGKYTITVYSEDTAGNINENIDDSKIALKRAAEISFGIDKTKPVITPINLESEEQYPNGKNKLNDDNKYTAKISITDNLVLDTVQIYLNGKEVKYKNTDEDYSFDIGTSSSMQKVKIMAADAAGNKYETDISDILVSTNVFARWYNNSVLFIGSIIGISVIVVLLGVYFVFVKRRKSVVE